MAAAPRPAEAASAAGQEVLRWDLKENPIFRWLTYYHDAHISAGPPCHWVLAGCHHGRDHWYYRDYLHQLLLLLLPPPPPFPTPPPVSSPLHNGWCCLLDWHETTHRDNFCLSKKLWVKLKYHYIWYKIWEYMAFSPTWLWSPTVGNTATKMDFDLSSKMYLNRWSPCSMTLPTACTLDWTKPAKLKRWERSFLLSVPCCSSCSYVLLAALFVLLRLSRVSSMASLVLSLCHLWSFLCWRYCFSNSV